MKVPRREGKTRSTLRTQWVQISKAGMMVLSKGSISWYHFRVDGSLPAQGRVLSGSWRRDWRRVVISWELRRCLTAWMKAIRSQGWLIAQRISLFELKKLGTKMSRKRDEPRVAMQVGHILSSDT